MTGAERPKIANNTVYGCKGMVDLPSVRKIVPESPQHFLQLVSSQALLETNTTTLSSKLRMPAMMAGMHLNWRQCGRRPLQSVLRWPANELKHRVLQQIPSPSALSLPSRFCSDHGRNSSVPVEQDRSDIISDGSDLLPATLDDGNYTPRLGLVPTGVDNALFSGAEWFFVSTNGYTDQDRPTGAPDNEAYYPWRQGLNFGILGESH